MGKSALTSTFHLVIKMILILIAAVTMIGAFAGYVPPASSTLMPLLGMALPVLLLINLLLLILLAVKGKKWAVVPLLALLVNWNYLAAVVQIGGGAEKRATGRYLKVFTYNVQNFGGESTGYTCKKLARRLQEEQVDIVCFQEFGDNHRFTVDSIRRAFSHWKYSYIPTKKERGSRLANVVFSRYPLKNKRFISFDEHSSNSAISCDIELEGETIRLFCNHLQTTSVSQKRRKWERQLSASEDTRHQMQVAQDAAGTLHGNFVKRAAQAETLNRYITESPHPVVLCGDLNSLPSSYTYRTLTRHLEDGFRTAGSGYMYTYRYAKHLLRIDYILHSPSLTGISYTSLTEELCSDHNPVLMELEY